MWRAAKEQNSEIVTASVESWDWIHYLVESEVVDYEYRGKEDDKACAENISSLGGLGCLGGGGNWLLRVILLIYKEKYPSSIILPVALIESKS